MPQRPARPARLNRAELNAWYKEQLTANGMRVQPPGDQLRADLEAIGETMTDEWLEAAGEQGKLIVEILQVDVAGGRGLPRRPATACARSSPSVAPVRPWLDRLYDACGAVAAVFLLALLVVITLQMVARWSGQQFPGSTDYAGYCMAAASFFALAYALNRGAHIRVSLLLGRLGRWRRAGELWCFAIAAALAWSSPITR